MDEAFKKDHYSCFRTLWTGSINGSDTLEYVVPDSMPDIGSIMDSDALISIRSKETLSGRLRALCDLSVCIFYQPENEGKPCFLNLNLSCEASAAAPEIDSNSQAVISLRLSSLDVKILNSRKISVCAELTGRASCVQRSEFMLAGKRDEPVPGIEVLMKSEELCTISDVREKTFVVTDELSLPSPLDMADRIAMKRVSLYPEGFEFVGSKLVFRGMAEIFLLLCRGDELYPCHYESKFSQVMETDGSSVPSPELSMLLTGAFFDLPEHSGGKITAELHILAQLQCWRQHKLDYIADVYSPRKNLIPVMHRDTFYSNFSDSELDRILTAESELPPDAASLVYIKPSLCSLSQEENQLLLSLQIKAVYERRDGVYGSTNLRIKEMFELDPPPTEGLRVLSFRFSNCLSSLNGGRLELRIPVHASLRLCRCRELEHVMEFEISEKPLPEIPSVTLRRVGKDCDLWALAKEYRSSICAIQSANKGREEGLLLIPRVR